MISAPTEGADTRRAAVLGHPIAHSLSPVIHRAAYSALGLPWQYDAIDVEPNGVEAFVAGCGPAWVGLSLTMPLKEAVLPVLTQHSPVVELAQAANTVLFEAGERIGHNTDVTGMIAALAEAEVVSVDAAAVLGSGATARSALVALQQMGAREVDVVARPGTSAERMLDLGRLLGLRIALVDWSDPSTGLQRPLVISTVPSSVAASAVRWLPPEPGHLFDVIYAPWPTELGAAWSVNGVVLGGLDLLVHQACGQIELMTGACVPPQILRQALDRRGSDPAPLVD